MNGSEEPDAKRQRLEDVGEAGPEAALATMAGPPQNGFHPEPGDLVRPACAPSQPPPSAATKAETLAFSPPSGAAMLREQYFQQQEAEGELRFVYISNDGQTDHLIWLIALKNIFSKQLPNMPKEYISRLVLDRRHRSVVIVRRDSSVVGGITYRPFHAPGFGEIAFCAVSANDQVKGFGSRLMSHTKEYAKVHDRLACFLTYADNNAVGYFTKQGFSTKITLPGDRWRGYIKDYDGGTLMEGLLHARLPYTRLPEMLHAQRAALDAKMRLLSRSHIVYPGIQFPGGPGAAPLDVAAIPGVREAGWTQESNPGPPYRIVSERGEAAVPTKLALTRLMRQVLTQLQQHEDAWPFLEAVSSTDVPDYYDVVKDPVDLSLIERRLDSGTYYITLDMFQADVRRVFANARIYNAPETIYVKVADRLEAFLDNFLTTHLVFNA